MFFECYDRKARNPYLSLALDEALCLHYGRRSDFEGGMRIWANDATIVLGRTCKPDLNITARLNFDPNSSIDSTNGNLVRHRKSDRMKKTVVCRRASGGGVVLHGPGGINYSLFLPLDAHPELYPVNRSYAILLELIQNALHEQGIETEMIGLSDIALCNENGVFRKISGNAQLRRNGVLMLHGTLITDASLIDSVAQNLLHPPVEPDYRAGRSHDDFLGFLPNSFDIEIFYDDLKGTFLHLVGAQNAGPIPMPERKILFFRARKLVREVYGREEWILLGKR